VSAKAVPVVAVNAFKVISSDIQQQWWCEWFRYVSTSCPVFCWMSELASCPVFIRLVVAVVRCVAVVTYLLL